MLDGQIIKMAHGGVRIWLELTISGWDPDGLGQSYPSYNLARFYIMVHNQYLEGVNAQPPSDIDLVKATQPCSSDAYCRSAMSGHDVPCSVFDVPVTGVSRCLNNLCEPAFLDLCHPSIEQLIDLGGGPGYCGPYHGNDGIQFGCYVPGGVEDQGQLLYFGTLVLDVPENAKGKYVIPVLDTYFDPNTWWDGAGTGLTCHPFDCPFDGIGASIFIGEDCNNNVILDEWEIEQGTAADVDQDNIPDECEADCQPNGVPDHFEISSGVASDCDANNIPDDCDVATCEAPGCRDCNSNMVLDKCDLESGVEFDVNGNAVPDSCEGVVPAVSNWGLVRLSLALLTVAKLRRKAVEMGS